MWSTKSKALRKIVVMYNIDIVIALKARKEAITKKLNNLTQNVGIVHQPILV